VSALFLSKGINYWKENGFGPLKQFTEFAERSGMEKRFCSAWATKVHPHFKWYGIDVTFYNV
jgi:hypothetical protein